MENEDEINVMMQSRSQYVQQNNRGRVNFFLSHMGTSTAGKNTKYY